MLRTDQGKEFINTNVEQLLLNYGIEHETSEKFTSEHNGLVEQFNRTIEERTCALLADSGFPQNCWHLAIETAEYLYNRTQHSAIQNMTPYSMWYSHTVDIRHLVLFGARVYVLQCNRNKGTKFSPAASREYVCGYTPTGYVLFNPITKLTQRSCNIRPDKNHTYRTDFKPTKDVHQLTFWDTMENQDNSFTQVSPLHEENEQKSPEQEYEEGEIIELQLSEDFSATSTYDSSDRSKYDTLNRQATEKRKQKKKKKSVQSQKLLSDSEDEDRNSETETTKRHSEVDLTQNRSLLSQTQKTVTDLDSQNSDTDIPGVTTFLERDTTSGQMIQVYTRKCSTNRRNWNV